MKIKERPILFSAPMIQAILEGRKTQTRRIVKPQPTVCERGGHWWPSNAVQSMVHVEDELQDYEGPWAGIIETCNPYGQVGDQLWIRETFGLVPESAFRCSTGVHQTINPKNENQAAIYRAGWERCISWRWKPSIHMPRWASRIQLEITNIRIERLNDISESDCLKEGVGSPILRDCKKPKFMQLWESINGVGSWSENPWVWVVEFKVIKGGTK